MSGEGEAERETFTVNEMTVLGPPLQGPRRYVRAITNGEELWMVDGQTLAIVNDNIVAFYDQAQAQHFIDQARAADLGVFGSPAALFAHYEAQAVYQAAETVRDTSGDSALPDYHDQQRRRRGKK